MILGCLGVMFIAKITGDNNFGKFMVGHTKDIAESSNGVFVGGLSSLLQLFSMVSPGL